MNNSDNQTNQLRSYIVCCKYSQSVLRIFMCNIGRWCCETTQLKIHYYVRNWGGFVYAHVQPSVPLSCFSLKCRELFCCCQTSKHCLSSSNRMNGARVNVSLVHHWRRGYTGLCYINSMLLTAHKCSASGGSPQSISKLISTNKNQQ